MTSMEIWELIFKMIRLVAVNQTLLSNWRPKRKYTLKYIVLDGGVVVGLHAEDVGRKLLF